MTKVMAVLLFVCFSLTHAGAASLFALEKMPDQSVELVDTAKIAAADYIVNAEADDVCCVGDEETMQLPTSSCSASDCHYLLQSQAGIALPDYLHVISTQHNNSVLAISSHTVFRPPIT